MEEIEFTLKTNHEAKLKELLRNLTSTETTLYLDSAKEFIKILKSDTGPEFVRTYVQTSSKLVELSQAWEFRKGKPGFVHILNVVSAILKHWKYSAIEDGGSFICRSLDKFARSLIEERMVDFVKELNSKEAKRQNAVLLLLASIVLRNPRLACEVTRAFDFKLAVFPKLAEVRLRARKVVEERKKSHSTRKAFVSFAMAFLEVGDPRMLRGILQQKEMYSGVLRGLGNDDEETVIYVLSILRDRVLVSESLVPPGLRSVLFGSVTLEQLVGISGRNDFGDAAELAHNVLLMVCTDPVNGLMPDLERQPSPLRGNRKRLMDLMKKLKATESEYHRSLLLAVVKGCPSFGSSYLDEFPYSLEDLASDNWFGAISLAADVVSSVREGLLFGFVDKPPAFDSQYVQNILSCIGPRPFTKLVINKGLLHSDSLVKHGTLKLVLEALKLLDLLAQTVDSSSHSDNSIIHNMEAFKLEIQNEVRTLLPDPQVLISLLSPLNSHFKSLKSTKKRKSESEIVSEHHVNASKKLKTSNEELDIVISGVNSSDVHLSEDGGVGDSAGEQQAEEGADTVKYIRDLWGLHETDILHMDLQDGDTYFYSKILDVLKIYHRTMPTAMEGLSDFFKFLPKNPLVLPAILQESLLQLLTEHVNQFSKNVTPISTPPQMYRNLYPFIILLMFSPARQIREQAYALAKAAMLSTGAFDNNTKEICAWFFFIPGYSSTHFYTKDQEVKIFQKLSSVIVSFLCDAVSTTGNNLYKYMELLKHYIYGSEGGKGLSSEVSPFIICVLEKCFRLLSSESGSFTLPQKSLISHYVCNTIKYLLDTQVNAHPLSFLVDRVLSEKLENSSSPVDVVGLIGCPCEWRPVKTLLRLARDMSHRQFYSIYSSIGEVTRTSKSFTNTLNDIKGVLRSENDIGLVGLTMGFSFSLMCTNHTELLQNLPLVLSISSNLLEVPFSVLSSIFFLESSYLTDVLKLWPEMFSTGLKSAVVSDEKEEEMFYEADLDSMEAASVALSSYYKCAPFYVLFSSILQSSSLHLFQQSVLQKLLLDKLTGLPSDHLVSSLCNVLFWINHANTCYRVRSSDELKTLSEMCFVLAEHLLNNLLVEDIGTVSQGQAKAPLPLHYALEVAEIIFNHPAVTASLNSPLSGNKDKEFSASVFRENLEVFLELAKQGVHSMDQHVLDLIIRVSELLSPMLDNNVSGHVINDRKRISRAFRSLVGKLFQVFKNKFDSCVQSMNFEPLVPTFYALYSLIRFISPFDLLELVNWLLSRVDFSDSTFHQSSKEDALFVGLHLASCTFDFLSACMKQPYAESKLYSFSRGTDATNIDVSLFERIFVQVLEIACRSEFGIADTCLLKAVKLIKKHKVVQEPHFHSVMVLSRVMASTPVNILQHCLHKINKTKAELLYYIVQMSPLHMSTFGFLFSEMLNKSLMSNANLTEETCMYSFSDEELMLLLPTVLLYVNSIISKFGEQRGKPFESIISAYDRILLTGFSKWKNFVFRTIFEIGFDVSLPASTEEILNICNDSLLVKAVHMVRDHLLLSEDILKFERRLSLFNSACPSNTEDIFDYNCGESETELHLLKHPLEFVNRVVAKLDFCRMLIFPDYKDNGDKEVIHPEFTSDVEKTRVRFLRMLINSWISIVKEFPEYTDNSRNIGRRKSLFRFLEVFIMENILELTAKLHDSLIKLSSLPFVEQFVKSFLLHRFGDSGTLNMLRIFINSLSHAKFACASVIQLLLAHSQFAKSISFACQSLVSTQFGLVFTPTQSILKSFLIHRTDLDNLDCKSDKITPQQYPNLLELVKLVRILFGIYVQQREVNCREDTDINFRELVCLLLSSYGATCSEVDLELYNLMLEIESNDKSSSGTVAEMDYLWGLASIKVRNDWKQEKDDRENVEVFEEHRKIKFRENILVDPKLCAQTVLYFPYDRFVNEGSFQKLQNDSSSVSYEGRSTTANKVQIYDPVFILRFSIHCLSMSYIEPVEFASLGLLAITFVSISSPDDDMRKLGYEILSMFKYALEKIELYLLAQGPHLNSTRIVNFLQTLLTPKITIIQENHQRVDLFKDWFPLFLPSYCSRQVTLNSLKCQKKKDVRRLHLLLTYLQNGIEEPWQRISSITAAFLAEASLVLLDPSHDNYSTISKHLMNSSSVNTKYLQTIPLFPDFFRSSSVNFRAERQWMLRLLYVGLNTEDDAQIYIRNSIFDTLLSFYSSPSSDKDSKELIIQIVKKAVQLHKAVWFLVEHCGLVLWLSSIVSSMFGSEHEDRKKFTLTELPIILEVVSYITTTRNIVEWLQEHAMEQLSELSSHLFKLLVGGVELFKENITLCNSILQILTLVLKISQKRKIYQPHFTLSGEGLFQLSEAVEVCCKTRCNSSMVLGLQSVLMCTPPLTILRMDQEKLLKFLKWAVTTAVESESTKGLQREDSDEDSLVSKLLRWLTASVILGKNSCNLSKPSSGSFMEKPSLCTLQSLLGCDEKAFGQNEGYRCEDVLAASIIYLLQLLGFSHRLLPSAVSALVLLLFSGSSPESDSSLDGPGISLPALCSKIHCPAEANPTWRWSYYQPWEDCSVKLNDTDKLDEIHACERILVVASNILVRRSKCLHTFTFKDVDDMRVHEWERSLT